MDRSEPVTGEIYKHFKGKLYQIVTVATHSETKEKLVIYQALYGDFSCCARPLDMFLSEVDRDKYPNASQRYRFEKINKSNLEKVHSDEMTVQEQKQAGDEGEVNPDLLAFLEADTFAEKKNLLVIMQKRMTDDLINSIAASLDISVDEGDLDKRYTSLYNCVAMMEKYEVTNRLR